MIRTLLAACLMLGLCAAAEAKDRRGQADVVYALTPQDVRDLIARNGFIVAAEEQPSAAEIAENPLAGIGPMFLAATPPETAKEQRNLVVLTLRSCGRDGFAPDECLGLIIARPIPFEPLTTDQAKARVNDFHEETSLGRGFVTGKYFFVEFYVTTDAGVTMAHIDRMLFETLSTVGKAQAALAPAKR